MLLLIPLLPFLGFLLNASFGKRVSKAAAGAVACGAMAGSFLVSLAAVWQLAGLPHESRAIANQVFTWITSGDFTAAFTLRLDPLSSVMILVITGVLLMLYYHPSVPQAYADMKDLQFVVSSDKDACRSWQIGGRSLAAE